MHLDSAIRWGTHNARRLLLTLGVALVAYWILRGCLPSLSGPRLPSSLESDLRHHYTVCITDTPIWPGEPRQPECGQATFEVVGEGSVPADAAATGVDQTLCFHVTTTNPTWTTQGTTRHEIIQHGLLLSKVAVRQDDRWVVEPDEDLQDEAQWNRFDCPGPYRSEAFNP